MFVWNPVQMDNGNNSLNETCSHGPPSLHRPLRFFLNNDTTALSCGWTTLTSALRGGLDGGAFIFAVLSMCLTMVQKNGLSHVINILFLCLAAGFSYLGYDDIVHLRDSFLWCDEGMSGMLFAEKPLKISCAYGWLFVTCLSEVLMVIALILLCSFTGCFLCLEKKTSRGKVVRPRMINASTLTETSHLLPGEAESIGRNPFTSDTVPDGKTASGESTESGNAIVFTSQPTHGGGAEYIDFEQVQSLNSGKDGR